MSKTLGQNVVHHMGYGDANPRCPGCYQNSSIPVGILNVQGTEHECHKCTNCNRIFSKVDGGIADLIDEAKKVYETENVGFTITNNTRISEISTLGYNDAAADTRDHQRNVEQKLSELNSTIIHLMNTIETIARQNGDLMNRLATDPLVGMRKAISDFDLK